MNYQSSILRVQISAAFLDASDALAVEFPTLSTAEIYEAVGQAQAQYERHLDTTAPAIDRYRQNLISEGRIRLSLRTPV